MSINSLEIPKSILEIPCQDTGMNNQMTPQQMMLMQQNFQMQQQMQMQMNNQMFQQQQMNQQNFVTTGGNAEAVKPGDAQKAGDGPRPSIATTAPRSSIGSLPRTSLGGAASANFAQDSAWGDFEGRGYKQLREEFRKASSQESGTEECCEEVLDTRKSQGENTLPRW